MESGDKGRVHLPLRGAWEGVGGRVSGNSSWLGLGATTTIQASLLFTPSQPGWLGTAGDLGQASLADEYLIEVELSPVTSIGHPPSSCLQVSSSPLARF